MKDEELLQALAKIGESRDQERAELDSLFEVELNDHSQYFWKHPGEKSASELVQRVQSAREQLDPYDSEFRASLVGKISRSLEAGTTHSATEKSADSKNVVDLRAHQSKIKKPLVFGSLVSLLVATAAALALLFFPGGGDSILPAYSLTVRSGMKELRGDDVQKRQNGSRYKIGAMMDVLLRPQNPVATEIEMAIYLERNDQLQPFEIPYEKDTKGSIRIRGIVGENIAISPGDWVLWFAIAPKNSLPSETDIRRCISEGGDAQQKWGSLLRTSVEVLP